MYASIVGSGEHDAIFLPGLGHYGDDGRVVAEAIGDTHTTYLLDVPGTGRSASLPGIRALRDVVPAFEEFLDARGIEQVDVIGHSLGGIIGLVLAAERPARVRSLTLLDSGYWRVPRMPVAMMGPFGIAVPMFSLAHRIAGDRIVGGKPANAHDPGAGFAYEKDLTEISAQATGLLLAAYRSDPPGLLRRVTVPCLLAYGGRQGQQRAREKTLRSVRRAATSSLVTTSELRGGHDAHQEDPSTASVVRDFLTTVD